MVKETEYLIRAVEEANCSVVVMQYTKNLSISRTKVAYISKNAENLGLNMNAIKNGIRLPKDYIHPEDRPDFLDAVTVSGDVQKGFSNTLRVVGEDGTIHFVDVKAIYIDVDEKTYEVEYILREKSVNQVENAKDSEEASQTEAAGSDSAVTVDEKAMDLYEKMQKQAKSKRTILADESAISLFYITSKAMGLYSMVVDLEGKAVVKPEGPSTHMGAFYDMVDRPYYKALYEGIVKSFEGGEEKYYSEIDDGIPDSRIAATPIHMDGRFVATWILCAYDKTEKERLKRVLPEMPEIAKLIALQMHRLYIASMVSDIKNAEKKEIEFEIRTKDVLSDLLASILDQNGLEINSILEEAGKLLDIDYVMFFREKEGKNETYEIANYWSSFGRSDGELFRFGWNRDAFSDEEKNEIRENGYVVDHDTMTNRVRVGVFNGMARAAIIRPIMLDGEYVGRLVFFETRKERVWKQAELDFTKRLAIILERAMRSELGEGRKLLMKDALTSIFNEFHVGILVKNRKTGKTIFANEFLNRKLGFDLTGMDSQRLVPALDETMTGKGKAASISKHWRRYINELGGIFDISEVEMEWTDGVPASVIVLRVAQE